MRLPFRRRPTAPSPSAPPPSAPPPSPQLSSPPPPSPLKPLIGRDGERVAFVGHSHIRCVVDAARERGLDFGLVDYWFVPPLAWDDAFTVFHPDLAAIISRGTIVAAVGGGVHALVGLVRHPRRFDFAIPGRPDLPPAADAEAIPYAAVRDAIAANLADAFGNLALVRRTATGQVFQLAPPPPIADDALLARSVRWHMFDGAAGAVSPAPLRWKLWAVEVDLMRGFCREHDVAFVPPPAAAVDAQGYLREAYHLEDIHANRAYGDLVLAGLIDRL